MKFTLTCHRLDFKIFLIRSCVDVFFISHEIIDLNELHYIWYVDATKDACFRFDVGLTQKQLDDGSFDTHQVVLVVSLLSCSQLSEHVVIDDSHVWFCCRGQTPADAEFNYLDRAKRLEMYGVDLHNARVRVSVSRPARHLLFSV